METDAASGDGSDVVVPDFSDYEADTIGEEAAIAAAEASASIAEAAIEGAAVIEAGVQDAAADLQSELF